VNPNIKVIVGGQFGSEAKGAIAAHLARTTNRELYAIRVAGPNAGHTVYDNNGRSYALRSIPVAAVARPGTQLAIAAGSEVDHEVLSREYTQLLSAGFDVHINVDEQATILDQQYIDRENADRMHERLGSTAKGIGAARAARINRKADLYGGEHNIAQQAQNHLNAGGEIHIEGTQGYGLGLHAGHYPFCTSSDCRAIDFLSMAGINPWHQNNQLEIWVVMRTYPIRVAGNSGPLHNETTFAELSNKLGTLIEPERTTVTKKIRRIGGWDHQLAADAIQANGGAPTVRVALTFADYIDSNAYEITNYDELPHTAIDWIEQRQNELGIKFELIGTGPQTIIDRRNP